jgi:glyoxylase-like metal-dependent hydrolase (beta-lactamase superfamily II)
MTLDAYPSMLPVEPVLGAWTMLPARLPVPGLGALPVNAFLWKGPEPMLVDTGLSMLGEGFLAELGAEIDPADLRWIWLSHADPDHAGNLARLLAAAPRAEVVTTFLGMGKLGLAGLATGRVRLLDPAGPFEAGGRGFVPVRPPYYDAPETMGFFDPVDRVLFAAGAFGALMPEIVPEIDALDERTLRDGLVGWSAIDAPWLGRVDRIALGRTLDAIERLDPTAILSGHLPLARCGARRLTRIVAESYGRGTTTAPDALSMESLLDGLMAGRIH